MMRSTQARSKRSRTGRLTRWFWAMQGAVLLTLVVCFTMYAGTRPATGLRLPDFRETPLSVDPVYDDSMIVTDDQLSMVLERLVPDLGGPKPKINHVDHALRFWQLSASFDDPNCLSGEQMRRLLVDDRAFIEAWGESTKPLLVDSSNGISFRLQEGNASISHIDHSLASLAEVGTPLSYPIHTRDGETTLHAALRHAIGDFSLNQLEYEWTTLILALYAPHAEPWVSKEGELIDFDRLAQRIMRQRFSQGVCLGNHRIYTLVILLRVDDEHSILSTEVRDSVMDHLTDATSRLIATQSDVGYWDSTWAADGRIDDATTPDVQLRQRILATGHALEWWALAPAELHPPREVMIRAAQWLVREIESMSESTIDNNYTFLTHAGRALALWRGSTPHEFRQSIQSTTEP